MPRVDITSEYRSDAGQSKYPRLKLQAGEKGRIAVVGALQMEYCHRFNAPNIVNYAPTYKKIKGDDGSERFVVETRWVSSPLCLGDFDKLRERGVDEKGCPGCFWARERPDIFRPPDMRFAANIIRYMLRPGGGWGDIAQPYGLQSLVWVFSDKVFAKLDDIRQMGGQYADLRQVDLLIECSHDGHRYQQPYSKGEFMPFAPAVWVNNGTAIRDYTIQVVESNAAGEEDLRLSIGRPVKVDYMSEDADRVVQRWDVVRAYEARQQGAPAMGQGFGGETLAQGMTGLQGQYGVGGAAGGQSPGLVATASAPGGASGYVTANGGAGGNMLAGPGGGGVSTSSLLGGSFTAGPSLPSAPQAAAPPPPPPAAAPAGQWQPPGQVGDMFAPPAAAQEPSALLQAAGPELEQLRQEQMSQLAAAGVPADLLAQSQAAPLAGPASPQAQAAPPVGLAGLGEFMGTQTHNPSADALAGAPLTPPGPGAAQAAGAAKYTFSDLRDLAASQGNG